MPAAKKTTTALWLVPDDEAETYFQATIDRLAARYSAPVFAPHLTLGLGPAELLEKIPPVPLELEVAAVDCSDSFTKTLFVRFVLARALLVLRDSLGLKAPSYDPHLSLLYCAMPMTEKRLLAGTVTLPVRQVRFTAAAAIRCTLPVATAADIATWKTIARRSLIHSTEREFYNGNRKV